MLEALASVFGNAAITQKIIMVALVAALPAILVLAAIGLRVRASANSWPGARSAGTPLRRSALGLLVAGLNAFHMGQTILRLPFSATAKQLAPGILEVSTFAALGALVGVFAVVAHFALALFSEAEGR